MGVSGQKSCVGAAPNAGESGTPIRVGVAGPGRLARGGLKRRRRLRPTVTATPGDLGDTGVFGRAYDALERPVEVGTAGGRLISLSFPESLPADADGDHPILDRLGDYLDGREDDFADVEVAITVPTDRRAVLEAVRNVPHGESVDLARVVKMTPDLDHEDNGDLETARTALRTNPIPVVVPDHRVAGVSGATPESVAERLREIEGVDERRL